MENIFFKLKINIPDLDSFVASKTEPCAFPYLSELVIDNKEEIISIKIFYPDKEYLGEKILHWNSSAEDNLIKRFEVIEILSPHEVDEIDLTDSECIGISNSSANYVKFNSNGPEYKFVQIKITGFKIKLKETLNFPSRFYLNSAGFPIVEKNYNYHQGYTLEEIPYSWKPKNLIDSFIKFGKIEFKPEHNFYSSTGYDSPSVTIHKEPMLLVKKGDLSEKEISIHVKMICTLLSFYSNVDVESFVSWIYTSDSHYYEKKIENKNDSSGHGIFMWDFSTNPLNLIVNVDAEHIISNCVFVTDIVTRFNYAIQLTGESKFMILYNVLEQIRVQYTIEGKIDRDENGNISNPKKVIQEYEFNESNAKTDKAIRAALETLIEKVKKEQQDDFKDEISFKVKNIKLMSMANQFKSLFEYTNIDPKICNLDFTKVKKIRNEIFHGNPLDQDLNNYLDKITNNSYFPRFVGIMILKYLGIEDLKNIAKKYK